MSSQHPLTNLFFVSLKGFFATVVLLGILLGYHEKILGFSAIVVGSCLVGQSTQKMIQNHAKEQNMRAC
ncbi:MAG: hypothetical protein AB4058_02550 [Microcystaceae cyanobacterium]